MSVERVEAGGIFGVGDREIVGVDDEQFRIGRVAEAFGDGSGLSEFGCPNAVFKGDVIRRIATARLNARMAGSSLRP